MAQVNKYNPNTGKPLAKGETVTIKGTNTTVTEGKIGTGTTSSKSSGSSSSTSSSTSSTTSTTKNTYNYVDASGNIRQVQASSADEAMRIAPNIGARSGVQLVSATSPSVAGTSTVVRDQIKQAEENNQPSPVTDNTTWEDVETKVGKAPNRPSMADADAKLRASLGISAVEDEIGMHEEEKANLLAELDKFKRQEYEGQSLGFAVGRISTAQQQVQDQLDFITRMENAAINKLNYKNKVLEQTMKYMQWDYEQANSAYQFEFNKALQIQSQMSTEKNQIRDDARATLTATFNTWSKNGIRPEDITPDMEAFIAQQELQAGYDIGSQLAFYRADPKANVFSSGSYVDEDGREYDYQITIDPITNKSTTRAIPTGGVSTKETDTGVKIKSGGATFSGASIAQAQADLNASRGSDGYVNSAEYLKALSAWIGKGGLEVDFFKYFPIDSYVNPEDDSVPVRLWEYAK